MKVNTIFCFLDYTIFSIYLNHEPSALINTATGYGDVKADYIE
jgi:hypothetical protein